LNKAPRSRSSGRRTARKGPAARGGFRGLPPVLAAAVIAGAATIIAAFVAGLFALANTFLASAPVTSPASAPSATGPLVPSDNSEFIKDLTFPDGSTVVVKQHFMKKWEIKNIGTVRWVGRYLAPKGQSTGNCVYPSRVQVPTTHPGQPAVISVPVTAPSTPELCFVTWRFIQNYFHPRSITRVSAGQAVKQDHVKGGFE